MHRPINRRAFVAGLAASGWLVSPSGAEAQSRSEQRAAAQLRIIVDDLMAAQRSGTAAAFIRAVKRHADVESIALHALGPYQSDLPGSQRAGFYRGVAGFMGRYFADQSRHYRVARADIGQASDQASGEVLVQSSLTLTSGSTYNVTWRLARAGGRYKIRDITVLGFSLSFLQRTMFQSYIASRGGKVDALVTALSE